ncbi:MAG: OmpA family protein [Gemmatimonadetes bacterium]|nr:OmpA family protein [Gemmatimonadota bacterium]
MSRSWLCGTLALLVAAPAAAQRTPPRPASDTAASSMAPGTGVWRNYDFRPGDSVWFATDFAAEPVGRFPASQLQFVRGNMQIVDIDSSRALEVSSASVFGIALPADLPTDFSLEFEIRIPAPNIYTQVFFAPTARGSIARYPFDYLYVGGRPGIYRKGTAVSNLYMPRIQDRWVPVKLQVDSAYSIMYVGPDRAAQVPVVNFPRGKVIEFESTGNPRLPTYIRNIVVAVGLNDLYKALTARGEVSTLGILFDTNSDRLLPESTPVLDEIRKMLTEHPDLRLQVEGHTDDVGDDAFNLALSERRARSVVAWLVAQQLSSSRLTVVGHGERMPVGDNRTPAGRRANRRVVLRRLP